MGSWVAMGRLMDVAGHGKNGKTMKKTVKAKRRVMIAAALLGMMPGATGCAWRHQERLHGGPVSEPQPRCSTSKGWAVVDGVYAAVDLAAVVACRSGSGAAPVVSVAHAPPRVGPPVASPIASSSRSPLGEVALAAARSAADDDVVSSAAVRRAMTVHLGSGLSPHVLAARGSDAQIATQLAAALVELRRTTEVAAIGTAMAEGRAGRVGTIVALPAPALPIAIEHAPGAGSAGEPRARLRLAWPWPAEAAAFDVTPTAMRRLDGRLDRGVFELAIDCARTAGTIEISAGAQLIAAITNACRGGDEPVAPGPDRLDVGPPARSRVEVEQRLFELVNRERRARGQSPLAWDEASHRFARQHSADMARSRFVGHQASDGTPMAVRLGAMPARAVFENVGRAGGPGEAHLGFMTSPGHRANLLAREAERGAIGVELDAADPSAFYITQLFIRPR